MNEVPEISATELRDALSSYNPPRILDIREEAELKNGVLPHALHIPLDELSVRLDEIDSKEDWVVVSRSGVRSAVAVEFLRMRGYENVWHLIGGMSGYAHAIDPTFNVY